MTVTTPISPQRPFLLETAPRIRLILEYLRAMPEGILRKELVETCDIPSGSASYTFRKLEDLGFIRIAEVPSRGVRPKHLILPTDRLLDLDIEDALRIAVPSLPQSKAPQRTSLAVVKKPVSELAEETKREKVVSPTPAPSAPDPLPKPKTFEKLQKIVVTRHAALVTYMREIGLIDETTPVYPLAREVMIEGKHVFGVLPLHLAALAAKLTTVPMRGLPRDMRGKDLTLEQVRIYAAPPVTYEIRQVGTEF